MMPFEKKILNSLLDSYENSRLSRGENKVKIHISFPFQKTKLPEYFNESSLAYEEIHARVKQLESKGYLTIVWKDKKKDHIIEKVILCEESLPKLYRYMNRIPKNTQQQQVLTIFEQWMAEVNTPATSAFIQRMYERISEKKSVKEYIDISNPEDINELITTLQVVEQNSKECFYREFSVQLFHDSKRFEALAGRICRILKEEIPEYVGMENEDILAEYQILKNPGYVYLKGAVQISVSNELNAKEAYIDITGFKNGVGFSIDRLNIDNFSIKAAKGSIKTVYTIENLTSFYRFEREDSLVIYLGGYHNAVRRMLIEKVFMILPEASYYHFGDIDAGGFYIYHHLIRKTGLSFQLYQMNVETLKKYDEYGKALTENDRKRLQKLLEEDIENEEQETIHYMLKHNIKLEQECIIE